MDVRIKIVAVALLFLAGASLVIQGMSAVSSLWMVIPGIILLLIAYPWAHVLWAQFRSNHQSKSDAEIIAEAELEVRSKHGNK